MPCKCTLETASWHPLVRKWDRDREECEENYFGLLGLTENASKKEVADKGEYLSGSKRGQGHGRGHGSTSGGADNDNVSLNSLDILDPEKIEMMTEARDFLMDEDNRTAYRRYVMFHKGLCSKAHWKSLVPQRCDQWSSLIIQLFISLAFIGAGVVLSVVLVEEESEAEEVIEEEERLGMSEEDRSSPYRRLFITGVSSGACVGAGIISLLYLISVEFTVEQRKVRRCPITGGYVKKIIGGLLGGAMSGAVGVLVADSVIGYPEPKEVPMYKFVIEGAISMMADAFLYSLADGLVTGEYIHSCPFAVTLELTVALMAGAVAGSLAGFIMHHATVMDEALSAALRPIWPRLSRIPIRGAKLCLEHGCEEAITCCWEECREESKGEHHSREKKDEEEGDGDIELHPTA